MSITGFDLRARTKRQLNVWIDRLIEWVDEPEESLTVGAAQVSPEPAPVEPPAVVPPEPAVARAPRSTAPAKSSPTAGLPNVSLSGLSTSPTGGSSTRTPPEKPLEPLPTIAKALPPLTGNEATVTVTEKAAAKQKAHWDKTRSGVLQFVVDQGKTVSLREMHDFSEQQFFVAHVSFSRLMEELVDEDLLAYNHDTAEASITDKGLDQLA